MKQITNTIMMIKPVGFRYNEQTAVNNYYQQVLDNLTDEHKHARTAQSFMVDKEAIVNNGYDLSINRYKEVVYEEVEYDAPKVIMERIKALQRAMDKGMSELAGIIE